MKNKIWYPVVLRKVGDEIKEIDVRAFFPNLYTRDRRPSQYRELLLNAASKLWDGKEGRDWRIVQDQTVIGFHATRIHDGEVIEIR
jgi:hypothetical protein